MHVKNYYTPSQLAEKLNISISKINNWINTNKIPIVILPNESIMYSINFVPYFWKN